MRFRDSRPSQKCTLHKGWDTDCLLKAESYDCLRRCSLRPEGGTVAVPLKAGAFSASRGRRTTRDTTTCCSTMRGRAGSRTPGGLQPASGQGQLEATQSRPESKAKLLTGPHLDASRGSGVIARPRRMPPPRIPKKANSAKPPWIMSWPTTSCSANTASSGQKDQRTRTVLGIHD